MKTKDQLINLGLTETKADEVMRLESKMLECAVAFQFKKKDGTIRNAVGTLSRRLMKLADGTFWEPKGAERPCPDSIIRFWDCDKAEWRCFSVGSLIAVEG